MHLQESGEMYLEAIYVLQKKSNEVRAIDVAEYLKYSKPSVSRAMGLLKEGGYVITDENGFLQLTQMGMNIAEQTYERHTVLTNIFIAIGVPHDIAAEDACKIEHDISAETFEALKRHIEKNS